MQSTSLSLHFESIYLHSVANKPYKTGRLWFCIIMKKC